MLRLSRVLRLKGVLRFGQICLHTLLSCRHVAAEREALGGLLLAKTVEASGDGGGAAGKLIQLGFDLLQLRRVGWCSFGSGTRGICLSGCSRRRRRR